jgi:hypothetical protein
LSAAKPAARSRGDDGAAAGQPGSVAGVSHRRNRFVQIALGALTLVNVALAVFGVSMAMMSPMMFDSGGEQDQLLWAVFWSILAFPIVAAVCVFVPWLFMWLQRPRTALLLSAIPAAWLVILFAVIFIRY